MNERIQKCFSLLDLKPDADLPTVKQSYRELAQIWHPDRFANNERLRIRTNKKFIEIKAAYEEVCLYLKIAPSHRKPPPLKRPTPESQQDATTSAAWGEKAKREEVKRRKGLLMGPWKDLSVSHAVIRGPGDGQVIAVSQEPPLPFVKLAYKHGLWVSAITHSPWGWLTAATRWGKVLNQRFEQLRTVKLKVEALNKYYGLSHSLTAYAESPVGVQAVVMTKGIRTGTERYKAFATWPMEYALKASERGESVVGVCGVSGQWHLVTAQEPSWGGQRLSVLPDWEKLEGAIKRGWDESRRITSVAHNGSSYAVITTASTGITAQSYARYTSLSGLEKGLAEQWGKLCVLTDVCADDVGWLCVFSKHPHLG